MKALGSILIKTEWARGSYQIACIAIVMVVALSLNSVLRPPPVSPIPIQANSDSAANLDLIHPAPEATKPFITVNGVVEVQAETPIAPEVGGRIAYVSERFRAGATVKAGEILFRLSPKDFELQRRAALGELGAAKAALAQEEAESSAAVEDWNRVFPGKDISPLARREPQLVAARARVESAEAAVDTARLSIDRTTITAPESGRLLAAAAAPGQMLSPGDVLGRLYAFGRIEFSFTLPLDTVRQLAPIEGRSIDIVGRPDLKAVIDRKDGALDPRTRLVTLKARFIERPDVLPGEFFAARISEPEPTTLLKLPATAILSGDRVFIAKEEHAQLKSIDVRKRIDDALYVSAFDYADGIISNPPRSLEDGHPLKQVNGALMLAGNLLTASAHR